MTSLSRAALVPAVWLAAACAARQTGTPAPSPGASTAAADSIRWIGVLAPPATSSGGLINGSATLLASDRPNRIRALISIRNGTPGASYPWEVQSGPCGEQRPTLGSAMTLMPLTVGADGTAQVTTLISAALPTEGQYHVNVYRSRTERERIIACGNLNLERTG